MSVHISPPAQDTIEISPAPDLYVVEFTFGRQPNNRISTILPATCGLAAMTTAWELFPEYRRDAVRTHVHQVKYVVIDWPSYCMPDRAQRELSVKSAALYRQDFRILVNAAFKEFAQFRVIVFAKDIQFIKQRLRAAYRRSIREVAFCIAVRIGHGPSSTPSRFPVA